MYIAPGWSELAVTPASISSQISKRAVYDMFRLISSGGGVGEGLLVIYVCGGWGDGASVW